MEALAPDRRLSDRYVLEESVAIGGMATVWRAIDEILARPVAVKCLRDDLAHDPDFAKRFQREAIAAARLMHQNIISVYDTGVDDGVYFIVMEYFPGLTLQEMLRQSGALDANRAAGLMVPVLAALGYSHREGLIHRDVKPANILVSPDGRVKVTDFGIAKAAFAHGDLTTTGAVLGTVRYLSPEQVHGGEVDARSDIYSAGVVLYEMVTGRPPFETENDVATAMMRLSRDPLPPRAIRAGIPRALEVAILRAMARRPDERFQSAEAMQDALQRMARGSEPTPPRGLPVVAEEPAPSSTFRSWMLVPLVVIVLAAAAIAAGLALGRLRLGGPLGVRAAPQQKVTPKPGGKAVSIVGAKDYDPQGNDHAENPQDVGLVFDGNPGTAWATQHYNSAAFGNLKDGVGVWIDLGRDVRVTSVTIVSPLPGWTFELKTGTLPDQLSGPIADASGVTTFQVGSQGRVTVSVRPVKARGLLIWITRLAPAGGRFAAAVAEINVTAQAA